MLELAQRQLVSSAHDVSDGGFAICLAEACIAHGRGAQVVLPADGDAPAHALLFSEEPSRIIVSLPSDHVDEALSVCKHLGVPFETLGTVAGHTLTIEGACEVPVEELAHAHASALDAIVGE